MINGFLAKLPSTNFRIFTTMFLVTATAARYLASGIGLTESLHVEHWEPAWEWLLFLAGMSGLDLAQFYVKRDTHTPVPPGRPDVEDSKAVKPAEDGALG